MWILGLSPLIGASLLGSNIQQQLMVGRTDITREILKDIEDVEVDRGVKQAKTPVSDWYSEFQTYSVWYGWVCECCSDILNVLLEDVGVCNFSCVWYTNVHHSK